MQEIFHDYWTPRDWLTHSNHATISKETLFSTFRGFVKQTYDGTFCKMPEKIIKCVTFLDTSQNVCHLKKYILVQWFYKNHYTKKLTSLQFD